MAPLHVATLTSYLAMSCGRSYPNNPLLWPHSGAAAALTIAGMKILRTAWTDLPRQHLILIFTLFFFNYDYAHLSEGLPLNYFIIAILFVKVSDKRGAPVIKWLYCPKRGAPVIKWL